MKRLHPDTTGFVLRPTVTFLLPFVGAWVLWMMYILCTVKWAAAGPIHLITPTEAVMVTVINVGWLFALGVDAWRCRSDRQFLRNGHALGLGLSALVVLLIQTATVLAYHPLILNG